MTTHDYPGETNSPAQLDPTTASNERMVERSRQRIVDDPSWQRQADEFAANRGERVDDFHRMLRRFAISTAARPEDRMTVRGAAPIIHGDFAFRRGGP